MTISKLNNSLHKFIAEFTERPHVLMQTSRGWRLNVSALLFQGYEKEPDLKLYVARAKAAHPDESAYVERAAGVVRGVLKDASGEADGRGALLPSSTLHPPYLAQIAEYVTQDLCQLTRIATKNIHGESIISFANNILKKANSDSVEKAEEIRRWLPTHASAVKDGDARDHGWLAPVGCCLFFLSPEITYFSSVTHLDLADNKLSFLPSCIGKLTQLRFLGLQKNKLTFLPPEIGQLTRLEKLWINHNKLTSLPVELEGLKALTEFSAGWNSFTCIPHALRKTGIAAIDKELFYLPEEAFVPPTCWESFSEAFWNVWTSIVSWFKALLERTP